MVDVKICVGTNCSFKGSLDILEYLESDESLSETIRISTHSCFNKACKPNNAPVVMVQDELILKATLDKILLKIREKL
ncbi:MAG TPA: hypothetical protein DHW82_12685 [Spirochaetia bacterium]|nr:MAG: hypothetical protein A2Y41_06155 [Spirochaetes bacterium GWB1_36_13]HCL57846.1 hypothetical protein [Spirochaetia bacterium]